MLWTNENVLQVLKAAAQIIGRGTYQADLNGMNTVITAQKALVELSEAISRGDLTLATAEVPAPVSADEEG